MYLILMFRLYSLIVYLILISTVFLSLAIQSKVERYVNHFGKLFFSRFHLYSISMSLVSTVKLFLIVNILCQFVFLLF